MNTFFDSYNDSNVKFKESQIQLEYLFMICIVLV